MSGYTKAGIGHSLAGVWIEITFTTVTVAVAVGHSLAGVWIEIHYLPPNPH